MAQRPIRSITVGGKRWPISFDHRFKHHYAECNDGSDGKRRCIMLDHRILADDRLLIDSLLHEMLHAAGWPIDEAFVDKFAEDAAKVPMRFGFSRSNSNPSGL